MISHRFEMVCLTPWVILSIYDHDIYVYDNSFIGIWHKSFVYKSMSGDYDIGGSKTEGLER